GSSRGPPAQPPAGGARPARPWADRAPAARAPPRDWVLDGLAPRRRRRGDRRMRAAKTGRRRPLLGCHRRPGAGRHAAGGRIRIGFHRWPCAERLQPLQLGGRPEVHAAAPAAIPVDDGGESGREGRDRERVGDDLEPFVEARVIDDGDGLVLTLTAPVRLALLRGLYDSQPDVLWPSLSVPAVALLA